MLRINLEYKNRILFIRLEGFLDNKTSYKINNYLIPVLVKRNIQNVVLNLEKIDYIDRDGILSIKNIKKIIKHNKGRIFLNVNNVPDLNKLHLKIISHDDVAYTMVK